MMSLMTAIIVIIMVDKHLQPAMIVIIVIKTNVVSLVKWLDVSIVNKKGRIYNPENSLA
jgi:hypothetical protein